MIFNKDALIQMIKKGLKIYATSYENQFDIKRNFQKGGYDVQEVRYLGPYSGEPFEILDQNFIDGDWIYLIKFKEVGN
ncbi:MAG: hypothetical protein ACK5MW_04925 [Enterococcus sp.]